MGKLIATMNMSLDGYCDHTIGIANAETHQHFNELLSDADALLFGRITYQLMESAWPPIVGNPTGDKPIDDFAVLIDNLPKIVFSRTLNAVDWKNVELKKEIVREEIKALKEKASRYILAGSPSLIVSLTQLDLVDEYQLCIHPTVAGGGLSLFGALGRSVDLTLKKTKTFRCGVVALYYAPVK